MFDVSALEAYSKSNALQQNKKEMQEGRGNLQKSQINTGRWAKSDLVWPHTAKEESQEGQGIGEPGEP